MSDNENQFDLEKSNLQEETIEESISTPDPFDLINNSLMQMSLTFEPLKKVLNSILEAQKLNKFRIDQLTVDGLKFKQHISSADEKFADITSLIGDINPDNMVKIEDLGNGYYNINDLTNKIILKSGPNVDGDVDELRNKYDETYRNIEILNKKLNEWENRVSSNITICELREENEMLVKIYKFLNFCNLNLSTNKEYFN